MTDPTASIRRRYEDACAAAHAADLVGERWALLVIRELLHGPKRFGALRRCLPGISANVLTQRLEGLEASGIVKRRHLPPPAFVAVYELTPWGAEIEPAILALGRWATRSPAHDPTLPLSPASLMLSLRTLFDPARAGGAEVLAGFRLGPETFACRIATGRAATEAGPVPADAAFVMEGEAAAVAGALYGGRPLSAALADGLVAVTGDVDLAGRFVRWFPLPPKADPVPPRV